jgi:hypothetical protein
LRNHEFTGSFLAKVKEFIEAHRRGGIEIVVRGFIFDYLMEV